MKSARLWVPLLVFLGLLGVVAYGLIKPADRTVRSALVGKPLPDFTLAPMLPGREGTASAAFRKGRPRVLNVFASWCVPCISEAPQLMRLRQLGVPIDAVAIRDTTPAIQDFLARNGDPYQAIGDDPASRVQLAIGSSGVPESFVIDGDGKILLQHVGAIMPDDVAAIAKAAGVGA